MTPGPILLLDGITKHYPGVTANDAVDLCVQPGEIHALLGENGAGKSTLVKVLYGLVQPDAGRIEVEGHQVTITSPQQARALGIAMVFQHFSLFDAMTVAENVAVGVAGATPGQALNQRIEALSEQYGLALSPEALVADLSAGEKQRVEIVRALLQSPKVLVLDEPTSVLTPQEADALFETLRRLSADGTAIIYISHKLDEIRRLCQAATVLRAGKVVASCDPAQETAASLAEMMIGERVSAAAYPERQTGPIKLAVKDLRFNGIHVEALEVRSGEIVGIAGVAGNGQERLIEALSGEKRGMHQDSIRLNDQAMGTQSTRKRRQAQAAFLPEERLGHAAVPEMTITRNLFLTRNHERQFQRAGFIKNRALRKAAQAVVDAFDVRNASPKAIAAALSGGNLQKFVVGREIARKPEVFVVAQPTWGVDRGAAQTIHNALDRLARDGSAVLVISQDLDELRALCDRIAVIHEGTLTPTRSTQDWTEAELGLAMAGASEQVAA